MNANTQPNDGNPADGRSDSNGELGFALHDLPPEGSALRKLGKRLAELLDEDQWAECEQMLFEVADEIEHSGHKIYGAEAEQITRPLRELLERTLPMIRGAGSGTLAAEVCKAIGVPNYGGKPQTKAATKL